MSPSPTAAVALQERPPRHQFPLQAMNCALKLIRSGASWLYDIKHFAALLLKRELEHDPTWKNFTAAANRTQQQCSVTALAALNPPNQRGQARYLNLQELLAWGRKLLALLDHPHGVQALGLDPDKCQAKLGWAGCGNTVSRLPTGAPRCKWSSSRKATCGAAAFIAAWSNI